MKAESSLCEQPVSTQPLSETPRKSVRSCQSVCADMAAAAAAGRRLLATQSGLIGSFQIGTTTGNVPQVADSLSGSALPASLNNQLGSAGEASVSSRPLGPSRTCSGLCMLSPARVGRLVNSRDAASLLSSHNAAMLQETHPLLMLLFHACRLHRCAREPADSAAGGFDRQRHSAGVPDTTNTHHHASSCACDTVSSPSSSNPRSCPCTRRKEQLKRWSHRWWHCRSAGCRSSGAACR